MRSNLYDTIIENFGNEQFWFKKVRTEHPNGLFKTIKHEFDLIVLNPRKIIFFSVVDDSINDGEAALQLRGALNSIANKLSLSLNDFIVCGANEDNYFFLNRYNESIFVVARDSNEEAHLVEHIENEFSYSPEKFDCDAIRKLSDALSLSVSPCRVLNSNLKTTTTADGKTYVYKHGSWREASELNTEILFPLTAFGGMFGLHLFYQKKIASGALYFATLGLCGIGWLLDSFALLLGIYRDKNGKYLTPLENTFFGIITLALATALCIVIVMFFPSIYNLIFGAIKL